MKSYYYSTNVNSVIWSENKQFEIKTKNWEEAVFVIGILGQTLSEQYKHSVSIRLSESSGYNNQGHYFYTEFK